MVARNVPSRLIELVPSRSGRGGQEHLSLTGRILGERDHTSGECEIGARAELKKKGIVINEKEMGSLPRENVEWNLTRDR